MKYVIIAVLVYIGYFFLRRILRSVTSAQKKQSPPKPPGKTYNVNMIQDAEYREVKKD